MKPGERIRLFREKSDIDQGPCAEALGISQGYLAQVETGVREPSRELLIKFKRVYGLSSDYILYGSEAAAENSISIIAEGNPIYEIKERRRPENAENRRLVNRVVKILDSGNEIVVKALKSNVDAFIQLVEMKKTQLEEED